MTVQTNTNVASFNGNGVTQIFPIAFKFNNDTDLIVMLADDATGVSSLLTLNSDYTVSGEGDEEGGLINVVVAPAVGKRLFVSRVVDILQMTDLRNQGKFFAEVHEDAFDLLTMIAQQHKSDIARSLRVAETDPEPARIPPAVLRAGKLLAFDSAGNPTTALPVADSSTELRQELASAEGAAMSGYTLDPLAATISRTVAGVLREVSFSVTDFGAKGDGVSDDTPAFRAAVAWCRANGAHLRVPKPASFYLLTATIPLSSDALAPVSVIGDVPQWMGGESILISGGFNGPLFSANGISSQYTIAPAICNVSLRNLNTGTSACAIQSNYSSGLRVEHVSIQHCNYGIHSAAEMISPSFVEVCMVTPLGYTPGNVGVAGYKLAARNTRIFGGRVYSQQVCLDYSGDIISVMGLNCEFSQVIFRHGALASAVFVGCHFETSQVLLSNAPQLPINYESAWADNGSIGSGITGSVSFIGGVCYLDNSKSNLVVIKSGPSFTYSLNIEGMAVNHPNKIAGSSFALNSKVALPAGTKIRVRDCLLDVAYPPSDQYSGYDVETGSDGQRHVDKLRVNTLRSGRLVEGVVVPIGGYVDVPTGMGQFSNAVFDLAWRASSAGAEYTGTLIAVQAYDKMIFGSRTSAFISSADTDWTVSWVPASAAIRLTNASGVQKTVSTNIQVRHQM